MESMHWQCRWIRIRRYAEDYRDQSQDLVTQMSEYDFMPVCTDTGKSEQDKERMNKDIRKASLIIKQKAAWWR